MAEIGHKLVNHGLWHSDRCFEFLKCVRAKQVGPDAVENHGSPESFLFNSVRLGHPAERSAQHFTNTVKLIVGCREGFKEVHRMPAVGVADVIFGMYVCFHPGHSDGRKMFPCSQLGATLIGLFEANRNRVPNCKKCNFPMEWFESMNASAHSQPSFDSTSKNLFHIRRIGEISAKAPVVLGEIIRVEGMNAYNRYLWEESLLTTAGRVPAPANILPRLPELGQNQLRKVMAERLTKQLTEYAFETVRRTDFPSRPSRLNCLFASTSPSAASQWVKNFGQQLPYQLLEVEILDGTEIFEADAEWIFYDTLPIHQIEAYAHMYWAGKKNPKPREEILVRGPVLVRKVIETFPAFPVLEPEPPDPLNRKGSS